MKANNKPGAGLNRDCDVKPDISRKMIPVVWLMLITGGFYSLKPCKAMRIKDIVDVQGIRGNPLMGTGLVVGLNGTGDSALPGSQMLASLLRRQDDAAFSPAMLKSGSISVVMVTAELGPWDREGSLVDINISTLGDTKSLQGGTLLATELKGLDGQVYAVARVTSISTASWTVEGRTGTKVSKNHPTVGRVPNGAYVERQELSSFVELVGEKRYVTLNLREKDFATAERIRRAIETLYPGNAVAEDPGTVRVMIPDSVGRSEQVKFVQQITEFDVEIDMPAKIVINERTGTIVVGGSVGISEVAVAQGSLVVKVKEQKLVSQPTAPFTENATTAVVDDTGVSVEEAGGSLIRVPRVVTVAELAAALNAIGATPRDLIAIFNALKVAGALQARVEIM